MQGLTDYNTNLTFLVTPKIISNLPTKKPNITGCKVSHHITLADPTFATPGRIDLLIGQEVFWDLICVGQIKTANMPNLQQIKLGWIITGKYNSSGSNFSIKCQVSITTCIDNQLKVFWELEETPYKSL